MSTIKSNWLRVLFGALAVLALGVIAACGSSSSSNPAAAAKPATTAQIRHVFVITLENESAQTTFGTTSGAPVPASAAAPFLASLAASSTAPAAASFPAGVGAAFVANYYGTGHVSLDNYIAMLSGQSATADTDNDCIMNGNLFSDVVQTGTTEDNQVMATGGCVYPASVKSLPDQLSAAGFTWKGYEGNMGFDPTRESATCGHPTVGQPDNTQTGETPKTSVPNGDYYATRHDPFMYFHSIIDNTTLCNENVVNLENNLQNDLQSIATTANFNFITPSLCDDGHDTTDCPDGVGGLHDADAFLKKWVPIIVNSPAFKQDGLLIINVDEGGAPSTGSVLNTSVSPMTYTTTYTGVFCCNQQPGPNLGAFPYTSTLETVPASYISSSLTGNLSIQLTRTQWGGDQTGAVLISPFIKQGTISAASYNHYSMLKSIEDIFGLPYLGYAGQTGLEGFGNDIFTNL